jgi:hypothetical protein
MQQQTLFDEPSAPPRANPEEAIRDEILADLGNRRADVLDWLRGRLKVIYRMRVDDVGREWAEVSADDARRIIDTDPRFNGVCRNFLGQLFLAPGWEFTGRRIKSRTKGSHANELKTWRWKGE